MSAEEKEKEKKNPSHWKKPPSAVRVGVCESASGPCVCGERMHETKLWIDLCTLKLLARHEKMSSGPKKHGVKVGNLQCWFFRLRSDDSPDRRRQTRSHCGMKAWLPSPAATPHRKASALPPPSSSSSSFPPGTVFLLLSPFVSTDSLQLSVSWNNLCLHQVPSFMFERGAKGGTTETTKQ